MSEKTGIIYTSFHKDYVKKTVWGGGSLGGELGFLVNGGPSCKGKLWICVCSPAEALHSFQYCVVYHSVYACVCVCVA